MLTNLITQDELSSFSTALKSLLIFAFISLLAFPGSASNQEKINDQATADIEVYYEFDNMKVNLVNGVIPLIGTADYTLYVKNNGPDPATNLRVQMNYHDEVQVEERNFSTGSWEGYYWNIPELASGEIVTYTEASNIYVPYGLKWVQAFLTTVDQADPDSSPNGASFDEDDADKLEIFAALSDIELSFTADNTPVYQSFGTYPMIGTSSYSFTVTNNGPIDATNLEIFINYHDEVVPLNREVTMGNLNNQYWTIPNLAVGATAYFTETSKIIFPYNDKWVMAFLVEADQLDPDSSPNGASFEEDDADRLEIIAPSADLDLTMAVAGDLVFDEYEHILYEVALQNLGPDVASNVSVNFPLPEGMVFSASNTTLGNYDLYYETWNVGTLEIGQTVLLSLDLFTLDADAPKKAFAQVQTVDQPDPDSTPGNDLNQVADEDDEAEVTITPAGTNLPDLLASVSSTPNHAEPGESFTTFFDLRNNGTVAAAPSTAEAFLSVDDQLSGDDVSIGSQSLFTAIDAESTNAEVPIDISIVANQAPGDYFLILMADSNEEINESNENNNDYALAFTITGGSGTYCGASGDFPWHEWISLVQINQIDHASGKSNYSDFTNISTDLQRGGQYNVHLQTGFSYFTYEEYWSVWIDFNQNGSFTDPGEIILNEMLTPPADGTANGSLYANINIPSGAQLGDTRMRIVMQRGSAPSPCGIVPIGEVEDYTVNIIGSGQTEIMLDCPDDITMVLPAGSSEVQVNWSEPSVSTTCMNGIAMLTQTGGQPSGTYLTAGVYFVEYTASDDCGNQATCTFVITVQQTSGYCESEGDFPWHDWISKVTLHNFTNASGKSHYSDFTDQVISLDPINNYHLILETSYSYTTYDEYWHVWIDYNQNGIFEDPNEFAFFGILERPADGTASKIIDGNIFIPGDALPGLTRMRVSMKRGDYASPCEMLPFGEVEDYTINIGDYNNSPNSGNTNKWTYTTIQSDDLTAGEMRLFPNPAKSEINLVMDATVAGPCTVQIYNVQGELMLRKEIAEIAEFNHPIQLVDFNNGMYFMSVQPESGKVKTSKFVVDDKK